MTDSSELTSRVHLVTATPWQQAVDCYFNPDDDVDIDDLRFGFPGRWDAGDLFVVVTTDSHTPAIIVVEESETDSDATRSHEHTYMGPFDFGLSIAAVEARLATTLPAEAATLAPKLGERLLQAIESEASDPTSWRELDERGCLADVADWPPHDSWAPCACCGRHSYDGVELEQHALADEHEQEFFGFGPLTVCMPCHDRLHRPLAPGADDVMFGFRPLCPSCSAMRTFRVIWGMPAGPPGPGTDIAGCVITSPFTPEYRCGECDYVWTDDDEAYRPLPPEDTDARVRARIDTAPPGVYRPFSRVTEPGRVIVGDYMARQVSSSSAWGPGVVHEL
ncbi:hypothetical protein, partial [Gordonia aquimaris]